MSNEDKKLAIYWLANKNYNLVTVAQHFGMTAAELARELNTERGQKCVSKAKHGI